MWEDSISPSFSSSSFITPTPFTSSPTRFRFIRYNKHTCSITHVHRWIGYHNPNWHSLTKSVSLTYLSVYDSRHSRNPNWHSLSKSMRLTNLSVYDRRDSSFDLSVYDSRHSRNPNWHSLSKSMRLTNLSVYDRRDSSFETAPSPSPPILANSYTQEVYGYRNPNWHSLFKSSRLTNLSVYDSST